MLYGSVLFAVESVLFFGKGRLWKLRWLLYSHYFLLDFWLSWQRTTRVLPGREGDLTYGETPFWTVRSLLAWSGMPNGFTLWDLGCGRGGVVLFSALCHGARAVAIDVFPIFIQVGRLISRKLGLTRIEWVEGDFLEMDLSKLPRPDLIYLASTTFSWNTIQELARRLEALPSETRLISLSASLPSQAFRVLDRREFWFSWGKATAYLQERL